MTETCSVHRKECRLRLGVVLYGVFGLLGGAVGGLIFTIGLVIARARLDGAYFHDADELVSWIGLPLVVGPILGAWIGAAHPPGRSIVPGSAIGLTLGVALGGVLGDLFGNDSSDMWAGFAMGGALGLLLGVWVPLLRHFRRRRLALEGGWELGPRRPLFVSLLVTALFIGPLVVLVLGATEPDPPTEPHVEAMPDPALVESVILFTGDGGLAREETHPIVPRIRAEVERWAELVPGDSSVVVLLLGDNVYPLGLGEPGSLTWAEDSAKVAAQVSVVAGPRALEKGARAIFLAGNHDWGERNDYEGALRVGHLGELLGKLSATGPAVALLPPAGAGGPAVVDVGAHLRLILLDTAWWLLEEDPQPRIPVLEGVAEAMATAGSRQVVIAAHHPFDSGGPHGGMAVLGESLGVRALLSLSGALLQDLRSRPYAALRQGLVEIFREHGPPVLFAGGHEHSIQLVRIDAPTAPRRSLVTGSASKLTAVGVTSGLLIARSEPGFARLLVLRDGSLHLSLESAPAEYLSCPEADTVRTRCMAEGVGAYRVIWSEPLPRDP